MGEVCHFIDLLRYLIAQPIVAVNTVAVPSPGGQLSESVSIALSFADGSIGTVHYFANGARAFPKERIEVFMAGRTLRLNNFRTLESFSAPRLAFRRARTRATVPAYKPSSPRCVAVR